MLIISKTSTVPLVNTKVEPSVIPEIREHLQEIKTVHKALVTVPQGEYKKNTHTDDIYRHNYLMT